MRREQKTVTKRLRLTKTQAIELDEFLSERNMTFSALVLKLITNQISNDEIQQVVMKKPSVSKIEREALLQLARIGNNLNQTTRALNFLCKSDGVVNLEYAQILVILRSLHEMLEAELPELPRIKRSNAAVEARKKRHIERANAN